MSMLLSLLMTMGLAHAASPATCPDIVERHDGIQIQQLWSDGSESCFFTVTPRDAYVDLIYRDYLFTSDGSFMVFNSYGPGDESKTTAAREFYMFPRINEGFTYSWDDNARELTLINVTGDKVIFDSKKGRLKSISGGTVTVADYVEPANRGGVEISNYQGLILDGGFKIGSAPTGNPSGSSFMKDVKGTQCKLKNSEVFKYTSGGDVVFKYSDKTLIPFLKQRCPNLATP